MKFKKNSDKASSGKGLVGEGRTLMREYNREE